MHRAPLRRLILSALLALCLVPATAAAAPQAAEQWTADSKTAISITGDVRFASDRITFANGQSLPLTAAGTVPRFRVQLAKNYDVPVQIFRVARPADPPLLNGNTLCGGAPVTFIAVWTPPPSMAPRPGRMLEVFSGNAPPSGEQGAGFCGSYSYDVAPVKAAAAAPEFPRPARSWGGIVRSGPRPRDVRIASLREGDQVTILARSQIVWNGFPWFQIRYGTSLVGYQWGGILCSIGSALPGTYKVCPATGAMDPATVPAAPQAAGPAQVRDLGAVPGAITQPEGKRSFASQIEGKTETAPLGTVLPAGLTRDVVLHLVAPEADPARVTLVGAKPWPHLVNGYVAIVCAAHDATDRPAAGAAPACEANPDIYLGVLQMPPGGEPQLVARTLKGFALTSDWAPPAGAPILLPSITPDDTDEWPAGRSDESVAGFDLAPYEIAPDTYAFGLRSDQTEGYSGGYATFETLHLFAIDGKTLRRILVQPIYVFKMTAGDWNKDGTRQHEVSESKLVVAVQPDVAAEHYELRVTELGSKHRSAVLRWNPDQHVFWVPAGKR